MRRRPRRRRNGASLSECYGGPAFACGPRVEPRVERGKGVCADALALDRGDPPPSTWFNFIDAKLCFFSLSLLSAIRVSYGPREARKRDSDSTDLLGRRRGGVLAQGRNAPRLSPIACRIWHLRSISAFFVAGWWWWRWRRSAHAADCGGVNEATSTRRRPSAGGALAVASA